MSFPFNPRQPIWKNLIEFNDWENKNPLSWIFRLSNSTKEKKEIKSPTAQLHKEDFNIEIVQQNQFIPCIFVVCNHTKKPNLRSERCEGEEKEDSPIL